MEDMIEVTKALHYENYRRAKHSEKQQKNGAPQEQTEQTV